MQPPHPTIKRPLGYYINLDKSMDRRRQAEAELAKVGLARSYRRFSALDGRTIKLRHSDVTSGEAGCFMSHLGVMEAGQKSGRHFHVMEDDTVLSRGFATHLNTIFASVIDSFDIVFTDMWLPSDKQSLGTLLQLYDDYLKNGAFNIIDNQYSACMASYVVNINAVGKLIRLLGDEARSGVKSPIDVCLSKLVTSGDVKVGCLFPFVTSISLSQVMASTINRPQEPATARVIAVAPQAAFYVEADLNALKAIVAAVPSTGGVNLGIRQQSVLGLIDTLLAHQTSSTSSRI